MEEVVEAAIAGLDDSILPCGLILCCMRGRSEEVMALNLQTIDMVAKYLGKGVVAADLAGAEALFPTSDFRTVFEHASRLGIPFTIHAGEAEAEAGTGGVECIRHAISFGASRIGHGILSYKSPDMLRELASKRIPLEICPTSNLCTQVFGNIFEYPYPLLLRYGVKFCLNTDDMTVEGVNLRHEYELIRDTFGMTRSQAGMLLLNATDMAFAPISVKESLRQHIRQYYIE